jgi:spore coat protein U-like protein
MKFNKQLLTLGLLAVSTTAISYVSAGTGCLGTGANCSTNTTVTVTINPGDICIGSTGAFDFGQYTISSASQTVNGTFSSPFWVDDLKGSNS